MLEQESAHIIDVLATHTIGSGHSLSLADVLSSNIPRPVKTFLREEVYRWLSDDLAQAPHFQRIPEPVPGTARQLEVFLRATAEGYIFTRTQFLSLLESAVHFVLNYLCRPQWTLRSFVFDQGSSVPVGSLRKKFSYVSEYLYLPTIIERVLRQRGWNEITESDFSSLAREIDTRITREHSARELAELTKPIFDFLATSTSDGRSSIPVHPIVAFFEDKDMIAAKEYILTVCHARGHTSLSMAQLGDLLEELLGAPETTGNSPPVGSMTDTPTESAPPVSDTMHEEEQVDREHRETEETQEIQAEAPPVQEEAPPVQPDAPREEPAPPMGETRNLRDIIAPEQRLRFIRTIFDKDASFYETLITKFNSMKSWTETSHYLRDVFSIHSIDPFSPAAVEFTDVLHQRFRSPQDSQEQ